MKEDEAITTGGSVKKQPIEGLAFEQQPTIESKREAALQKIIDTARQEQEDIRKARKKREIEATPEGKLATKQWDEDQEIIKQQQAENERIYYKEILPEAKRNFILIRLADGLLKKEKVNEQDPEFEKVLQRVRDIYNIIESHHYAPTR